jgi:hypothetical protein
MGAKNHELHYISLPSLVELKLAAGRVRDEADVVELIRANPKEVAAIREHLTNVHPNYVNTFDQFVDRANDQRDA